MMSLYFAPLACSLATRIALYEAGAHVEYIQVDTCSKRLRDGSDFYPVSPGPRSFPAAPPCWELDRPHVVVVDSSPIGRLTETAINKT